MPLGSTFIWMTAKSTLSPLPVPVSTAPHWAGNPFSGGPSFPSLPLSGVSRHWRLCPFVSGHGDPSVQARRLSLSPYDLIVTRFSSRHMVSDPRFSTFPTSSSLEDHPQGCGVLRRLLVSALLRTRSPIFLFFLFCERLIIRCHAVCIPTCLPFSPFRSPVPFLSSFLSFFV